MKMMNDFEFFVFMEANPDMKKSYTYNTNIPFSQFVILSLSTDKKKKDEKKKERK